MEKFEVYNRKLNKWDSENISIVPGWSENWVLDKTTDTMSLKLKYKSTAEPNFNVGDWCRILHAETPTYESILIKENEQAYKPLNHEQYIIGDITLVENKIAGEWDCQLKLKEPIEITSGILCETMSFTNQISKTVDDVVYKHEPLNHLSVLEKILKVTPANNDLQKSWWSRIKICNRVFLENIPFNDETYSEPSLYNILMDKYDSSVGRTPVLYFDMNPETDLPNDLKRETYVLNFERQDGFDKEDIELSELTNGHNEIIINKSDENFTDGLVSNYDNLSLENASIYVSEDLWAVPEINNNDRDLKGYDINSENGIWVLRTQHNIKKILSIERLNLVIEYYLGSDAKTHLKRTTEDVTDLVLEKKQYIASEKYNTRNAIWFEEGTNIIHLNDYYYYNNEGYDVLAGQYKIQNLKLYRIKYEPLVSGRYDLGQDYQTPINQVDSQIDSGKFGGYLKDYFASMNKADIIVQKTVDNFADIKEVGTRVIDGDKTYIITNVSIQNRSYDYEVIYQLNENHIRKSDLIVAPQEIRKDIAIGIDATKERKSMLNLKLKLGLSSFISNNWGDNYLFKQRIVSILSNKGIFHIAGEIAKLDIISNLTNENNETIPYNISRLCEIARYNIGNTFCFNMRYFDNAEAGKQKELALTLDVLEGDDVKLGSVNNQLPVLYTDPFGEFEKFNLNFINTWVEKLPDVDVTAGSGSWAEELLKTQKAISPLVNYPTTDGLENLDVRSVLTIDNINYYKDMLDTFNYTIGITIEPEKNIILCKNFFKNNSLIKTQTESDLIARIKTYDRNLTENDYKTVKEIESSDITYTNLSDGILSIGFNELNTPKCFVLVDGNDEPLMIVNDYDKIRYKNTFYQIQFFF